MPAKFARQANSFIRLYSKLDFSLRIKLDKLMDKWLSTSLSESRCVLSEKAHANFICRLFAFHILMMRKKEF